MIYVDGTVDGTNESEITIGLVNVTGIGSVGETGDGVGIVIMYVVGTDDGTYSFGTITPAFDGKT
jgi:hypothetical protein